MPIGLFVHAMGVFTPEELDSLERLGDGLMLIKAPLGETAPGDDYASKRITEAAAIDQNEETRWIYERMAGAAGALNQAWRFDLKGLKEVFQYLVYRGIDGGHFDWHIDQGPQVARKLSMTLQMTDPSQYEGCELQFEGNGRIVSAPRARGTIIAFPADTRHRVSPIVSGVRKSIVAWAC